jgi:hypothetical protein
MCIAASTDLTPALYFQRLTQWTSAGKGRNQGTVPLRILALAVLRKTPPITPVPTTVIVGYNIDDANVYHAFTWYPTLSGSPLSFDAPGAGTLQGQGTLYVATDNFGPIYNTDRFRLAG